MNEKVIRDGKVAVLVSPGYGAGWSTWADDGEAAVFSPEVVAWVEGGKDYAEFCKSEFEWEERYGYCGGAHDLYIEWLPVGTRFYIEEYDGSERLQIISPDWGFVA